MSEIRKRLLLRAYDRALAPVPNEAGWQKLWDEFIAKYKVGDVVTGTVTRKVKGGLLVNVGVNAFLPASQVDRRLPLDIDDYIGKSIDCKILKIHEALHNVIVSRRKLIEDERAGKKARLLAELKPGQIRKGVVKSVTDFGAFIEIEEGIQGLLHVSEMAWGYVNNPHEVLKTGQELEVSILEVDNEKGNLVLSLKHALPSPWQDVEPKYAIGSRHTGKVVRVMSYGVFVKLEPGIVGLVHISELSRSKRIDNPHELVSTGDYVEVQVLNVNKDTQEISLSLNQVKANPWHKAAERYLPNTQVEGVVRNFGSDSVFIEIEEGINGLLHVNDMSWVRRRGHPSAFLNKGDKVKCVVLSVDQENRHIALGLKQMTDDPWDGDIPSRYHQGDTVRGRATKIIDDGVLIELEPGLEGLLRMSELELRVLRVDAEEREISLTMRGGEHAGRRREG